MIRRRVEPSVFVIDRRGLDAQLRHAGRLLLSGWDIASVATLTGLTVETITKIASTADSDERLKPSAPP